MTTTHDAIGRLQQAAQGTPFLVEPTSGGATVRWNIADQKWAGPMSLNSSSRLASADVRIDEAKQSYSRGVSMHEVDASAGPGALRYGRSLQKGTVVQVGGRKELGVTADGVRDVGYAFDTRELTGFIDSTLEPMGLSKGMDTNSNIGLYVALGAVGLAAVVGVVLLFVLL